MQINNLLVSIILPTYNSEKYISETINSILQQSYLNWELLITDDNSWDSTTNIVESFQILDDRIKLFVLPINSGVALARNNSLKHANGQYIALCDSDDIWDEKKLELQLSFMVANNYYFTYTNYYIIDSEGEYLKSINSPSKVDFKLMLKNNYVGCSTVMYNYDHFNFEIFPLLKKRQDWAMWFNLLSKIDFAYCYPSYLTYYRIRNDSISNNKLKLLRHNFLIYHEFLRFDFFKSLYFMSRFLFYHFKFKIFNL